MASLITAYRKSFDPLDPDEQERQMLADAATAPPLPRPMVPAYPRDLANDGDGDDKETDLDEWLESKAAPSRAALAYQPPRTQTTPKPAASALPQLAHEGGRAVSPLAVFLSTLGASLSGKPMDTGVFERAIARKDRRAEIANANAREDAATAKADAKEAALAAKGDAEKQTKLAAAAANADPNSPQSQRRRNAVGPLLKQFGLTDDELARLSAADLDAANTGDLIKDLGELRRRAQERKQASEDAENKRAADMKDFEARERFKYDLKHKGGAGGGGAASGASSLEAARKAVADIYGDKVPPEVAARLQLVEAQRDPKRRDAALERLYADLGRRQGASATAGAKVDAKTATDAAKYGTALEKSNIPQTEAIIARLRRNIEAAKKKNGGQLFTGKDEAIRRGPMGGWSLMSPESQAIMEDVQKLQNVEIKDTSGAAVTVHEMPRVKAAQGTGVFSDEAALQRYVDRLSEGVQSVHDGWRRAYGPKVVGAYEAPNRIQSPQPEAPAANGGKTIVVLDGKPVSIPIANLEAAKQKYGDRLVVR